MTNAYNSEASERGSHISCFLGAAQGFDAFVFPSPRPFGIRTLIQQYYCYLPSSVGWTILQISHIIYGAETLALSEYC